MRYFLIYIPKLAIALSGGNPFRALWLIGALYYFIWSRKLQNAIRTDFILRGNYKGRAIVYNINQKIDLASLIEIYVWKEYDWDCGFVPKTILDLGANIGDTALYYNAVYTNATIIAVEPEPANFARLQKNVSQYNNIIAVNCALGIGDEPLVLHLAENGLGHSVKARKNSSGSVQVAQASVAKILAEQGLECVDLIKFDIEGGEVALFKEQNLTKIGKAFIGELHFDLNDELKMENITASLHGLRVVTEPAAKTGRFILKAK